jgi:hypothetical protein
LVRDAGGNSRLSGRVMELENIITSIDKKQGFEKRVNLKIRVFLKILLANSQPM